MKEEGNANPPFGGDQGFGTCRILQLTAVVVRVSLGPQAVSGQSLSRAASAVVFAPGLRAVVVYLLAGRGTAGVARRLAARLRPCVRLDRFSAAAVDRHAAACSVVVEHRGLLSELGDHRTAIRSRPCHVVVLAPTSAGEPHVGLWLDPAGRRPDELVDEILARTASERTPLVVSDYDDAWPRSFEQLAAPVRAALAGLDADAEHVGSTSVPGLAAKPIVDIDVVVGAREDLPVAIERLRALGYVYQGDKGIRGREAFLWPPDTPPHHLYVVLRGNAPHRDHVDFRDYLRAHPEVASEYAALKKSLAEQHAEDRLGYLEGKSEFVTRVLELSRSRG